MGELPADHETVVSALPWQVLSSRFYELIKTLPDRLFPPLCMGCDDPVSHVGTLCGICWSTVRFLEMPLCPVMGTPFKHDFGVHFLSGEAIADPPPFRRLRSVAQHHGAARHASIALKYYDRLDCAPWMAKWMQRCGYDLLNDCDVIIPVPLQRRRLWQRRYNQAAELARLLAAFSDKPYEAQALLRARHTRQQAELRRSQRQENVAGAFKVLEAQRNLVLGRKVLLVDDVYTTGATVKAATRALLKAGAVAVDVLTFGRVLPAHEK